MSNGITFRGIFSHYTRGSPSFRASTARPGIPEASPEARTSSARIPAFA
jgi:hypothetical protein